MQSILQSKERKCYICGHMQYTEQHHIFFGTANRKLSDQDGLWVYLCQFCHRVDRNAVHGPDGHETDLRLKREAQKTWMKYYGKDIRAFVERYGKNYL